MLLDNDFSLETKKIIIAVCILIIAFLSISIVLFAITKDTEKEDIVTVSIPSNWDKNYSENYSDYETQFIYDGNWDAVKPTEEQDVSEYVVTATSDTASMIMSTSVKTKAITDEDIEIISMSESEAWSYLTNGIFNSYQKVPFISVRSKLVELQNTNTETITVKCWFWEDPADVANMHKVTVTKTFAVNTKLAETFQHVFEDIYNDPTKPIINIDDKGMGTWVLRGKNHNSNNTMSSHSLGTTIDINPSTGSFYVNGTWYGNAYGQKAMPYNIWQQLPETHAKYHVLYVGCPIVEIFKSYGFYWGGDWKSGTDCMHLGFIGDGSSCREIGYNNYLIRK